MVFLIDVTENEYAYFFYSLISKSHTYSLPFLFLGTYSCDFLYKKNIPLSIGDYFLTRDFFSIYISKIFLTNSYENILFNY